MIAWSSFNMGKDNISALEFRHFLPRQIKCRGNYMKIHFVLAFPRQCFCLGWPDFIFRASVFTLATSAKISTRSKFIRLLPLLNISPRRRRSIMCRIIEVQILLYKYCYMQCNVLFSHVKKCVLKILDALFEFKSKEENERKMLNRLRKSKFFKRKIYINSFCLMSQVPYFSLAPADEQMVKE